MFPSRILGPHRSCKTATCRSIWRLSLRISARTAACSSCVPCAKFSRNTLTPASSNWRKPAGLRDAGPIVATIFVRIGRSSAAIRYAPSLDVVPQLVEGGPDHPGAGTQACAFGVVEGERKGFQDPLSTDQARLRNRNVAHAENVLRWRAHGQDRALVVKDCIDNSGEGAADAVVGGPLAADNGVRRATHLGVDVLADLLGKLNPA